MESSHKKARAIEVIGTSSNPADSNWFRSHTGKYYSPLDLKHFMKKNSKPTSGAATYVLFVCLSILIYRQAHSDLIYNIFSEYVRFRSGL